MQILVSDSIIVVKYKSQFFSIFWNEYIDGTNKKLFCLQMVTMYIYINIFFIIFSRWDFECRDEQCFGFLSTKKLAFLIRIYIKTLSLLYQNNNLFFQVAIYVNSLNGDVQDVTNRQTKSMKLLQSIRQWQADYVFYTYKYSDKSNE